MREYKKPLVEIERFVANVAVAGCTSKVTGTETTKVYEKQNVYCIIGSQNETVFNNTSGCSTSANKYGVTEYNEKMYFVWYTYAGDTGSGGAPSASETNKLNAIVKKAGFEAGPGWHYSEVTGTTQITDILGFSY